MPIPSSETPEPSPAGGSEAADPAAAVPADSPEPGPTAQPESSAPGTSETRETGGKTENTRKSALTDFRACHDRPGKTALEVPGHQREGDYRARAHPDRLLPEAQYDDR